MSDEVPPSWAESTIGECFLEVHNGTTATQNADGKGLPVSRIESIQNSRFDLERIRHIENLPAEALENFRYRLGDIAFSHINSYEHVGKTALYEGEPETFIHGMNLLRLRFGHNEIEPRFAHLFMQTNVFREDVRKRVGHAVNQVSINQKNLAEVPFIVAPLGEQRRIVAKLEKMLGNLNVFQRRLAKIPVLLKRFRQSVLAAACSGRLTADWREEKGESVAIAELQGTDYEAPSSWRSAPLVELAKFIDYRGRTPKKVESGIPLITAKNIRQGFIDREPREFIRAEDYDAWMTRGIPRVGDVLITTEAPLGYVATVDISEKFALAQRAICLQFHDQRNQAFARVCMISPVFQGMLTEQSTGSMVSGIKASRLKQLHLLIPPHAEQQEIVRRVEGLFALADQVEARYAKAKAYVEKLTPSLLARSFRGGLVPQDPNDEPASVLLERIRNAKRAKLRTPEVLTHALPPMSTA